MVQQLVVRWKIMTEMRGNFKMVDSR